MEKIKINTNCDECGNSFIWEGDRISRFSVRNGNPAKHFCNPECQNRHHSRKMSLNNPMQGKKHSLKVKEFIQRLNTGRKLSPEQLRKKIIAQTGKEHSIEWRLNISKAKIGKPNLKIRGKNNVNWKGGISSEIKKRYMNCDWKLIRKEVLIRYNFQCQDCGNKVRLDVHHIIPYRICKEHKIENLIPLCKSCHMKKEWE